jgi:hypothetical protein
MVMTSGVFNAFGGPCGSLMGLVPRGASQEDESRHRLDP